MLVMYYGLSRVIFAMARIGCYLNDLQSLILRPTHRVLQFLRQVW